ncbi:MAG: hypothetical protein AAF530_24140 [Pseudomonadota bacterium]
MLKSKTLGTAMVLIFSVIIYPQVALSDGFNGEDFLKWPRDSQNSLVTYSITMTAIVASQVHQDIATCIDDWYPPDGRIKQQRQGFILDTIRSNPSYHPQAVILAVLQQQCGSFGRQTD